MADEPENWVCPICGTSVETASLGLYAEIQCPQCAHTDRVHTMLGNYMLQGVLGIGGMSVVYRALDVELDRPLALKVLNESFRDQAERADRFENECAMMARVRHENVTAVYSAGHAFGQFYIAMEMVAGKNLEHLVTPQKPMRPRRALGIIRQVALGLEAAAKAGLLHRDMKPGNVLITPGDKVKVIDFGLAVDSQEGDTEEIIWATPYYVPPETLERQPEDVRTDIYALGMTLRYLLTGIERFEEPTDSITALTECKRNLPPFDKQCPTMPATLCKLVDHMTSFAAADRPKDYTALLEELDDVQQDLLEAEQRLFTPESRWRTPKKQVVPAIILSLLLGGMATYLCRPPKPEPRQEHLTIERVPLPADEAQTLSDALKHLEAQDYTLAVAELLSLSASTTDRTQSAWAARLAQVLLASRVADPFAWIYAQEQFKKSLSDNEHVSGTGRSAFEALQHALRTEARASANAASWKPLTSGELRDIFSELENSQAPAPVLMTQWFMLAELANLANDKQLYSQSLRRISTLSLPDEYQPLAKLLSEQADAAAREASPLVDIRTQIGNLMRHHQLDTGLNNTLLELINTSDSTTVQQARVLREVCGLTDAMITALKDKRPGEYTPGMNSAKLAELAGKVNAPTMPHLQDEASILGKLMEGERQEVFTQAEQQAVQNRFSEPFAFIVRDWSSRWNSAGNTATPVQKAVNVPLLGSGMQRLSSNASNEERMRYISTLVPRCNNCVLVRALPEQKVMFSASQSFTPLNPGQMMFCNAEVAQILINRGQVEKVDTPIVAVLGFKNDRHNSFSLWPGEIQPCELETAEHFQEIGAGKIIRTIADMEGEYDKLKYDPQPYMLTREVRL